MSRNDDLFNYGKDILVDEGSNGLYSISRPDYTSSSTVSTITSVSSPMRVARTTSAVIDNPISGATYYSIFSKVRGIAAGDIITRLPNDDLPITVLNNNGPSCATAGIITEETGKLKSGRTVLFDNVRFAYLRSSSPYPALEPDIPESTEFQVRTAVLWKRDGIQTHMRLEDARSGLIFSIITIQPVVNCLVLTLREGK